MDISNEPLPPRFIELKREIADSVPNFQERVTAAWADLLVELSQKTKEIAKSGTDSIPQVTFSELKSLKQDEIEKIKRAGCLVIRDIVDDEEARSWKTDLQDYVKANPEAEGIPAEDKQFFMLYWSPSQLRGRSHPNVLAASTFLNNLYHTTSQKSDILEGVDLSTPLSYADRFRIRHPGGSWGFHPPHVDSGSIERWEDPNFRAVFQAILSGNWRQHDPYMLENRLKAKSSLYGRANQASIFRTFQGWLALSETAPTQGTLKVFPDVLLSNAYLILRPFFRAITPLPQPDNLLAPENWEFDISTSDFPGIHIRGPGYGGPRPTPTEHPHLNLEETMISMPKVYPGDMVFWHCDMIHSVEQEHTGTEDSAVMYIPAVPKTPTNSAYIARQCETFLKSKPPPDFPQGRGEVGFVGVGTPEHILSSVGKQAMGLPVEVS